MLGINWPSSLRFLMCSAAAATFIGASLSPVAAQSAGKGIGSFGSLVVADAHPYRHCHNLPRKTYCHKTDRLPRNWPPNTNTPHNSETEGDSRRDCAPGSRDCNPISRNGKG